jgi:hypothetical protein
MFAVSLRRAEHTRHYSISPSKDSGWDVRLEEDQRLTRHVHYRDWHRVERAIATLTLEVADLTAAGWAHAERH